MMKVVLLAAGLSTRMGGKNKLICPIGDTCLVEIAMRNALHDIALAANCLHYFALTGERYPWVEWEQTA